MELPERIPDWVIRTLYAKPFAEAVRLVRVTRKLLMRCAAATCYCFIDGAHAKLAYLHNARQLHTPTSHAQSHSPPPPPPLPPLLPRPSSRLCPPPTSRAAP
mgnify:CR=1 FL=1